MAPTADIVSQALAEQQRQEQMSNLWYGAGQGLRAAATQDYGDPWANLITKVLAGTAGGAAMGYGDRQIQGSMADYSRQLQAAIDSGNTALQADDRFAPIALEVRAQQDDRKQRLQDAIAGTAAAATMQGKRVSMPGISFDESGTPVVTPATPIATTGPTQSLEGLDPGLVRRLKFANEIETNYPGVSDEAKARLMVQFDNAEAERARKETEDAKEREDRNKREADRQDAITTNQIEKEYKDLETIKEKARLLGTAAQKVLAAENAGVITGPYIGHAAYLGTGILSALPEGTPGVEWAKNQQTAYGNLAPQELTGLQELAGTKGIASALRSKTIDVAALMKSAGIGKSEEFNRQRAMDWATTAQTAQEYYNFLTQARDAKMPIARAEMIWEAANEAGIPWQQIWDPTETDMSGKAKVPSNSDVQAIMRMLEADDSTPPGPAPKGMKWVKR